MAQSLLAASGEQLDISATDHTSLEDRLAQGCRGLRKHICCLHKVGTWLETGNCLGQELALTVELCLTQGERLRPLSLEKMYMHSGRLRSHKSDMDHCRQWLIRIKNVRLNTFFHITSLDYIAINYLAIVSEPNKVISTNSLFLSHSVPLTQSASRVK